MNFVILTVLMLFCIAPLAPVAYGAESGKTAVKSDNASKSQEPVLAEKPLLVGKVDVVPKQFSVSVYAHFFPLTSRAGAKENFRCWTLVSEGMYKVDSPEIAVTVKMKDGESVMKPPKAALDFIAESYGAVDADLDPEAGRYLKYSAEPYFFTPSCHVGMYLPVRPSLATLLHMDPAKTVSVVALTDDEVACFDLIGAGRLLGKMATQAEVYPYPTWIDRERTTAITKDELAAMAKEPMTKAIIKRVFGVSALGVGTTLTINVPVASQAALAKALGDIPDSKGVTLCLSPDPAANTLYIWDRAGKPGAIGSENSDGTRLTGSYLCIAPGLAQSSVHQLNDGFFATLTTEDWKKVKQAAQTKTSTTINCVTTCKELVFKFASK